MEAENTDLVVPEGKPSDWLERGIAMIPAVHSPVFEYEFENSGEGRPLKVVGACAYGTMLIGSGVDPMDQKFDIAAWSEKLGLKVMLEELGTLAYPTRSIAGWVIDQFEFKGQSREQCVKVLREMGY